MKKVVLFYIELSHYRLPILERLAKHCDLTIVYNKGSVPKVSYPFKIIQIPVIKMGPFYYFKMKKFSTFLKGFDVVIGLMDLRLPQFMILCFFKRSFRLVLWGIGVSGSYTKKFNVDDFSTKLRTFIASHADSLIFYSKAPIEKFAARNFNESRMYIAHNTIDNIVPINLDNKRDIILFVGTLYRAKGVESLIDAYKQAYSKSTRNIPKLVIVGGGELLDELKSSILDNGLSENIELPGPIYNKDELKTYFDRAIFTVSPLQAGLSVLTSMSYGVPFVTCQDANTGGEILNIKNDYNGCLLRNVDDLVPLFLEAFTQLSSYEQMGINAFNYYRNERSPDVMANALIKCIEEA